MPNKPRPKRTKPHKPKLGTLVIKIPVTVDTLTAAMLLLQQLVALARIVKLPMQTEKEGPIPLDTILERRQI